MAKKLNLAQLKQASAPFEIAIPSFVYGEEDVVVVGRRVNIRDIGIRVTASNNNVRKFLKSERLALLNGTGNLSDLPIEDLVPLIDDLMPIIDPTLEEGLIEPKYSEVKEAVGDFSIEQKATIFLNILSKSMSNDFNPGDILDELTKKSDGSNNQAE